MSNNAVKILAALAVGVAIARILRSPKVCLCAGPLCACWYRR